MNIVTKKLLNYLLNNRVVDEHSAKVIKNKIEEEHVSIGTVLVEEGYFPQENMLILLMEFFKKGYLSLDDIEENFPITINEFLKIFAENHQFVYMDLDSVDINYRLSTRLDFNKLKKFGALPIREDDINVFVAFKDPLDIYAQESIQKSFPKKSLKVVVADPTQIDKFLNRLELTQSVKGLVANIRKELNATSLDDDMRESSGVLKLIEVILKTAIFNGGSDIHIEPTENNCIIRLRVDGMLQEIFIFDYDIYPPLSSRMKLLSNLDIAEKRKPQDGRFSYEIGDKEYDFRVSTLPITHGESIVMRILDKSKTMIELSSLGMHKITYDRFENAMKAPYGIVLVTGPTGSGKTTTLYAALNAIKSVSHKLITVEDPVEYQVNLIQQVNVNPKAGLTFASALKSILRQDPDIIMIGEIRDQETLRIAIQAALTGHLVFSTLHTNDAVSAINRMMDMGIEPYLISGALTAVQAQRLIRKLCDHCKVPITLTDNNFKMAEKYLPKEYQFYKAKGCDKCNNTGYVGRAMISEILPVSEEIARMIARGATKAELQKQADEEGFLSMFGDGIIRAAKGITSFEEVLRVSKE